ncbi:alpha/beta hydrolase [Lacticaseibacillus yichunensis]|uniref:Alpha/beta hydrolase n=1 Tax=Lacticaseibacillus yichunensis TaxID=2486015 RepID=A0ABW4CJP0_9LACO|nr:alpha/beta hydrolase [Lacticaseibacillus yichunensis]
MKKHLWFLVVGILAAAAIVIFAATPRQTTAAHEQAPVTLYLHGHFGNAHSMQALMTRAEQVDNAQQVLTATVDSHGQVTFTGHWLARVRRPLVKVVFQDNRTLNYDLISDWLHNVLVGLRARYGVKKFNIVAHSLGNAAVLYYELRYGKDHKLPQLQRYAAIAGNFDGIPGMHMQPRNNRIQRSGQPRFLAPDFRRAMLDRDSIPAGQIDFLNVYGDWDDTGSDGRIFNASSRALGWLVAGRARSYREAKFTGARAQHSQLRTNPKVARTVDEFLWAARK